MKGIYADFRISKPYRKCLRRKGSSARYCKSVAWLAEEVGELAQAIRKGTHDQRVHEFGDVIAWVFSLANQVGVDVEQALDRYVTNPP